MQRLFTLCSCPRKRDAEAAASQYPKQPTETVQVERIEEPLWLGSASQVRYAVVVYREETK